MRGTIHEKINASKNPLRKNCSTGPQIINEFAHGMHAQ